MGRAPSFPDHDATAGAFVRHVAERHGDRPLVIRGDERLTYADLERRSRLLARGLVAAGLGKGSRVGLLMPNGAAWIVGLFAAARIGALTMLANTFHKPRELGWTLRHADVDTLLCVPGFLGHDYLDRLERCVEGLGTHRDGPLRSPTHPYLRAIRVFGAHDRAWATHEPDDLERLATTGGVDDALLAAIEAEVSPADPMVVVYSSGSTAEPKGAVHAQGPTIRHAHNLWQFRDLTADDRIYTPMPLFWVGGLSFTLVAVMHAGACLLFEDRFDPPETLALLERERATQVLGWPHMGRALVADPTFGERDLSSIRAGTLYELLPPEARLAPEERPNSLGMTETLGPHSLEPVGTRLPPDKVGSFGRAAPGVEHRITDPATGEELPAGALGMIEVRGYNVLQGLYKREREDTFTPDGFYRTGDAGRLDADGHLYFAGRTGTVIKSAGYLVTPFEVETALEALPGVQHAFVVGVPHPDRGEDVAAAVVATPGTELDPDDVLAGLKEELSSYKVPRHLLVVASADELPWLDSGKIDLRGVQARLTRHVR